MLLLVASGPAAAQGAGQPVQEPAAPAVPPPGTPQEPEEKAQPPARQGRVGGPSRRERREPQASSSRGGMRARTPRTGGPVTQTLLLDANLMGGYDDNLGGGTGGGIGGINPAAMASGTVGTLDGGLAYRRGNARHSLQLGSRGMAFAYPDYLDGPVAGVNATVGVNTTLGRSTAFDGSQRVAYEPFFSAFSPDAGAGLPSPAVDQAIPVTGLFERRSLLSHSALSLTQPFGAQSLTAGYAYGTRRFDDAVGGDNTSHTANAGYAVAVSDAVRVRGNYQYTDLEFADVDDNVRPTRTDRLDGGLDVEVAASRSRVITFTITGGAARLQSVSRLDGLPYSTWVPVGAASVKVPLSRAWLLDAGYRREFSLLQGLTNDVYANDMASLSLGGLLTRRTLLQVGGSFGTWRTPLASGVESTIDVYGGSIQLMQMLTDRVGVVGSYNYYHHRFGAGVELPEGFPSEYDRNAVRLGITLRFPLIGPRALQAPGNAVGR